MSENWQTQKKKFLFSNRATLRRLNQAFFNFFFTFKDASMMYINFLVCYTVNITKETKLKRIHFIYFSWSFIRRKV